MERASLNSISDTLCVTAVDLTPIRVRNRQKPLRQAGEPEHLQGQCTHGVEVEEKNSGS
jgi:hypothetical protein